MVKDISCTRTILICTMIPVIVFLSQIINFMSFCSFLIINLYEHRKQQLCHTLDVPLLWNFPHQMPLSLICCLVPRASREFIPMGCQNITCMVSSPVLYRIMFWNLMSQESLLTRLSVFWKPHQNGSLNIIYSILRVFLTCSSKSKHQPKFITASTLLLGTIFFFFLCYCAKIANRSNFGKGRLFLLTVWGGTV